MESDFSAVYQHLARVLDALPNGFPSTGDGSELRLLEKLFTLEDADLVIQLSPTPETVDSIAVRIGVEKGHLRKQLKDLTRRGLINAQRLEKGLGFGLLPFVVGIYEMQVNTLDVELAHLVEEYFQKSFPQALMMQPPFHRIVPVNESVRNSIEIHPYESASALVDSARAWGVIDCICRKQRALIGEACDHPLDVCMVLEQHENAFADHPVIRALERQQAFETLKRAADAGLVHTVSNNQFGISYICNCCTCSCGILRGMAKLGNANVIARSAFVNTVDSTLCNACENCLSFCQFEALRLEIGIQVNSSRCVGCGVCIPACPSNALSLIRRPEGEILPIPRTLEEWGAQRLSARAQRSDLTSPS